MRRRLDCLDSAADVYRVRPVEQVVDGRMLGVYRAEHLGGFLVEVGLPSVLDVKDPEHDAFGGA